MPALTSCIYQGQSISVEDALDIKERIGRVSAGDFLCPECQEPVKPHRDGGHVGAHFEHFSRNANCSFSHKAPGHTLASSQTKMATDISDPMAIEGYEIDRKVIAYGRNTDVAEACKRRDNFTCQACGFRLSINGHFVIEAHHLHLVSEAGIREVGPGDLVSLCPTCHRIAHTRTPPFTPAEISKLRNDI